MSSEKPAGGKIAWDVASVTIVAVTFPPSELTMDHLVPIIRGGRSTQGNVVPACKECNSKKGYLLPLEWEEYLNSVKEEQ